jgi:hypothetical protein
MLDSAIHHRQNETQNQRSTLVKTVRVHDMVSCSRLMQYTYGSVTLATPLIFSHQGSYNNNSLGTFRYNLIHENGKCEGLYLCGICHITYITFSGKKQGPFYILI